MATKDKDPASPSTTSGSEGTRTATSGKSATFGPTPATQTAVPMSATSTADQTPTAAVGDADQLPLAAATERGYAGVIPDPTPSQVYALPNPGEHEGWRAAELEGAVLATIRHRARELGYDLVARKETGQ